MSIMKKVLFCTTVLRTVQVFLIPYINYFKDSGYEVHVAGNKDIEGLEHSVDMLYNIPFQRTPFAKENITASRALKRIIEENNYDLVHFHTPVASFFGRWIAKSARKRGLKVLYTAHGFHFYKGAPFLNWVLYFTGEWLLAHFTDCLIVINSEDYNNAKRFLKAKRIEKVRGVGVELERFSRVYSDEEKADLRIAYGCSTDEFILTYAAELNRNKNQGILIQVVAQLRKAIPNIRLLLVGSDSLDGFYKSMAKELGVADRVNFLGWRNEMPELLAITDVAVASSIREGLPVNIVEAMAAGKPIVASNNRGHRELIVTNKNGYIVCTDNPAKMVEYLLRLYHKPQLRTEFGVANKEYIQPFALKNVITEMATIYGSLQKGGVE